ncbi:MAG: right-handed parallel beta-helix repeat-containing protein [Actinomycetota bacterium]|nr:right-handed parallel beta-helix repeat-containing protein [Actinomycetota bacterium]
MFRLGRSRKLAAPVVAVVLGLGLNVVQADAAPVALSCGAVVTTSIVLSADIGPCQDSAIIVGADNVTIDLNGHQLFGTGGTVVIHQAAGVFSDHHTGVVVTNGTVHDMYHGVRIRAGSNNLVTRMTVRDNAGGDGVDIESSTDNVVSFNTVFHNSGFAGMTTFNANSLPGLTSARNTFTDNLVYANSTSGITVESGTGHIVRRNQIVSNTRDGVALYSGVSGITVESNQISSSGANGINVRAGANANIVRFNQVTRSAGRGIQVAGQSNQILRNGASANLVDLLDTNPTCDANVWSGNQFGTASPACTQG